MQKIPLSKKQASDAAVNTVLRRLAQAMTSNEAGVIESASDESLHDYRVALRQTRTLLRQARGVLPEKTMDDYHRRFSWLASVTSGSRDIEVYLDRLGELVRQVPQQLQGSLETLRAWLIKRRESEHRRLTRSLSSPRYRKLQSDWRLFLSSSAADSRSAPKASLPIRRVVDKRAKKLHGRIIKRGAAITSRSPDEVLHELRKDCKKLRYLVLLFRDIYPSKRARRLLEELAALQDSLGAHQDAHIQIAMLAQVEEEMASHKTLTPQMRKATLALRRVLKSEQKRARSDFSIRFGEFSRPKKERAYERLFSG